jgi:hypothetical protein
MSMYVPVRLRRSYLTSTQGVSDAEQDIVTPSGIMACANADFQGCCLGTGDVDAKVCYNLPDFADDPSRPGVG